MGSVCKPLCALVLLLSSAIPGFASPLNSKLLWLVPPGVGIAAGFENYADPHRHGQMLLSTHSNRLDLADWLSITGVDNRRSLQEGIEIASASEDGGLLTEHLLLVVGKFDRSRIFRSVELIGGQRSESAGEPVMIVQPFTREKEEMEDVRWLVILDDRIGMLGTPFLVKQALLRYHTHADADQDLVERLSQLPHDVSSWNVLVCPAAERPNIYLHTGSRWSGLVENSDVLVVGTRFGSKIRMDFRVHANRGYGAEFFKRKLASFEQMFASVLGGGAKKRRAEKVLIEADRVGGSIELSREQFQMWGEQGRLVDTPAHGE
jgi:hypothetical protein